MKVIVFSVLVCFALSKIVEGSRKRRATSNWAPVQGPNPSLNWNTNSVLNDQNRRSWNVDNNFRQARSYYDPNMNYWNNNYNRNNNQNNNIWYDQQRRSSNNDGQKWSQRDESKWLNWYNSDKDGNNQQQWYNDNNDNSWNDNNWKDPNDYEKWYNWFKNKYHNDQWNENKYKSEFQKWYDWFKDNQNNNNDNSDDRDKYKTEYEKWYDWFKNNLKPKDNWNDKYKTEYEKWYDWFKYDQNQNDGSNDKYKTEYRKWYNWFMSNQNRNNNWDQNKFKTEYEKWYDWFKNQNQKGYWYENKNTNDDKSLYTPWYDQNLPSSSKPWYSNWNYDPYINSRNSRQDTQETLNTINTFPNNQNQPKTLNEFAGIDNGRSGNLEKRDTSEWSQADPMFQQQKQKVWDPVPNAYYDDMKKWFKDIPVIKNADNKNGDYYFPGNFDTKKTIQKTDQWSFETNMHNPKWGADGVLPPWMYPTTKPIVKVKPTVKPGTKPTIKPNLITVNTLAKVDTTKKNGTVTIKPGTVKINGTNVVKLPTVTPLKPNVITPAVLATKPSPPQTILL